MLLKIVTMNLMCSTDHIECLRENIIYKDSAEVNDRSVVFGQMPVSVGLELVTV